MTDAIHSQLEQAYRLIKKDELDKAIQILKPIVAAQPNNADAWWLLANAVSDPQDARNALDNVLRLNPNHAEAKEQRDTLASEYPDVAGGPSAPQPGFDSFDNLFGSTPEPAGSPGGASDFTSLDDLFGSMPEPSGSGATSSDYGGFGEEPVPAGGSADRDDLFSTGSTYQQDADLDSMFGDANRQLDVLNEDPFAPTGGEPGFLQDADIESPTPVKPARPEKKPKPAKVKEPVQPLDPLEIERRANSRTSPFIRVLVVLLVIIVIAGGIGAAYLAGVFGPRNGSDQTPVPVTGVALVVTAPATAPAAGGPFQSIIELFTASQYTNVHAEVVQSSLGDTLQVQVCGVAGPGLQAKVNQAMNMVATEAARMRDTVKAAGVQFVSCAKPDVKLYRAIAPIGAVTAYVDGAMKDYRTFRAAWKTA